MKKTRLSACISLLCLSAILLQTPVFGESEGLVPENAAEALQPAEAEEEADQDEDINDEEVYTENPREVAEAIMAKEARNGFDAGVNILVLDGISFSIPAYFGLGIDTGKADTATYYAEKGTGRAAVWISAEAASYAEDTGLDEIGDEILENYQGAELISTDPIGLAGCEGRTMTFLYTTLNGAYLYRYAYALDRANSRLIRMYLGETQTVTYSYLSDFDHIVSSAFISGPSALGAANVDPEFLARMNGVEIYVNELVNLRQIINSGQDNEETADALARYTALMEQYEAQMTLLENVDQNSLGSPELNYYRQTYDRVLQKLNGAGIQ